MSILDPGWQFYALLLCPTWLGLIGLLGPKLIDALMTAFVNRDGGAQVLYERFMSDCRARGLDYRQAMAEWRIREEFARLRRECSDTLMVTADVEKWLDILDTNIKQAFARLRTEKPELLEGFAGMVGASTYADIYYPDQVRRIERTFQPVRRGGRMSQDRLAALTIISSS